MKKFKVTVILFVMACMPALIRAQENKVVTQVGTYLEANGTMRQYADAYQQLLILMEKQYPKTEANKNGWTFLERNEPKALMEIKDLLAPIYIQHFTEEELNQMFSFYTSDTGKQLVANKEELTEDQRNTVQDFFYSPVGQKLNEKKAALTKEIAAVSEYWSKDLYQTAVLLLQGE
ncbi:DUF2059 domain-containing protein [Croceivirga sp. JEA036]|uniref:DUF2059 domain-containing protein n=1 Tax=Croceivirga sp. JEA036 TaxID=2721162 RepID=UPI00143997FE|nr:DUF2059 domain-containing protein [Croceivirga sp. JEA036]NJB37312.1 DUF2059 domain-containing protein [Croceivirga sp. JEA036]